MKSVSQLGAVALLVSALSGAVSAQSTTTATAASATIAAAVVPAPAPDADPVPADVVAPVAPAPAAGPASVKPSIVLPTTTTPEPERSQQRGTVATPSAANFPVVTFGVTSFLQYEAQLHEANGYNSFDVTRGYLNIRAQLNDRVRVRFTPDVRPTTDANLNQNLALRLEYASLDVQATDTVQIMFGLHEMPWLAFEESVNRYRVIGPFFSERLGLIPGTTDLGVSVKRSTERTEVHVGIYNGEGQGRAEIDKYKSIDGRGTFRPFAADSELGKITVSGFYQYGWYARDRPRNVAIGMGSYESERVMLTAQYLQATDNPFVALDIKRRGTSFFGEARQGRTGWAGVGGLDFFDPDADNDNDSRRRLVYGGAHWSSVGRARLGIVVTMEQTTQTSNAQLLDRRLLGQTHVEF